MLGLDGATFFYETRNFVSWKIAWNFLSRNFCFVLVYTVETFMLLEDETKWAGTHYCSLRIPFLSTSDSWTQHQVVKIQMKLIDYWFSVIADRIWILNETQNQAEKAFTLALGKIVVYPAGDGDEDCERETSSNSDLECLTSEASEGTCSSQWSKLPACFFFWPLI